jgi:hypothetical protein
LAGERNKVRAVKEIPKSSGCGSCAQIDYGRELEAAAKFSQPEVCSSPCIWC